MRNLVIALVAYAAFFNAAAAEQSGADTDRCKDAIGAIRANTGTAFDHVSPSGNNIFLKHPAADAFTLDCRSTSPLAIFLSAHKAFPAPAFYALAAEAGAIVTSQPAAKLKAAAMRCHDAALKSKDEDADLKVGNVAVECTAFVRDGGGTTLSIAIQPE